MNSDQSGLLFLDMYSFDSDTMRGAALVTDLLTEPLEFRCTSPIRPTKLQKTLWGGRLIGHVAAQLIGKPLVGALTSGVKLAVIRKPEFLEVRPLIEIPVVQILRNEEISKASPVASQRNNGDDLIEGGGGKFEPVVLKVHRDYELDFTSARELLSEVFRSFNVLEPFERITTALQMVHQQESSQKKA